MKTEFVHLAGGSNERDERSRASDSHVKPVTENERDRRANAYPRLVASLQTVDNNMPSPGDGIVRAYLTSKEAKAIRALLRELGEE